MFLVFSVPLTKNLVLKMNGIFFASHIQEIQKLWGIVLFIFTYSCRFLRTWIAVPAGEVGLKQHHHQHHHQHDHHQTKNNPTSSSSTPKMADVDLNNKNVNSQVTTKAMGIFQLSSPLKDIGQNGNLP